MTGFPKSLNSGQRAMHQDGCPLACLLPSPPCDPVAQPAFISMAKTRDESPDTVAFREQVEAERLAKSRAKIFRMKQRFETKAIDFTKVRWDARRNMFVPLEPAIVAAKKPEERTLDGRPVYKPGVYKMKLPALGNADWSRITKDTAERLAKLNGIWKPEYEKLRGTGRIVMTVSNVLRGIVKRGGAVKWN